MKHHHHAALSLVLATIAAWSPGVVPAAPAVPPASAPMSEEECRVWRAEQAFARSLEQGDRDAFAAAVHPDAVFSGGSGILRGKAAVVQDWAALFEPGAAQLRWAPEQVAIGRRADLALSRGPYWIRNPAADAAHPLLAGEFTSTWTRDADGTWRVLFDGGSRPAPISEEALAKRLAAMPQPCS